MMIRLAVLLCSWKKPEFLLPCLVSLRESIASGTVIKVILNEADEKSLEILKQFPEIEYVKLNENIGAGAVDVALPLIKDSFYTVIINDDMLFLKGWDNYLISLLEANYPCAIIASRIERKNNKYSDVLVEDLGSISLDTLARFKESSKDGKKIPFSSSYYHPIMVRTSDIMSVNGYSDGFNQDFFPGYGMDDWFAYRLSLIPNFRFIASDEIFVYHYGNGTGEGLSQNGIYDPRKGWHFFREYTKCSIDEFKKTLQEQLDTYPPVPIKERMVYDCCTFFNEYDLLEIRLETLWDVVDKFIVVEGNKTHQGSEKPYYLSEALATKFSKYRSKLLIYHVDDFPKHNNAYSNAIFQRNRIANALVEFDVRDNDIVLISDLDEIARPEKIMESLRYVDGVKLCSLLTDLYYYYFNNRCDDYTITSMMEFSIRVIRYDRLKSYSTIQDIRTTNEGASTSFGGWHFSFLGGSKSILTKLQSYGHDELKSASQEYVDECLRENKDLFGRPITFNVVPLDESFPSWIRTHQNQYANLIKCKA